MNLEGRIRLSAAWRDGRIADVRVLSDRPLVGDLLLRGRALAEAPGVLPLALSLCGRSQAVVCAAACEAACGLELQPAARERRSRELAAETVQEHAWRLLLDWPRLAGEPEDVELLGRIRALARSAPQSDAAWGAARDALLSLVSSRLLGEPAEGWLELKGAAQWLDWATEGATPTARALHHLAGQRAGTAAVVPLLAWPRMLGIAEHIALPALTDAAFARAPTLGGVPQETGPLARLVRHPALAELAREHGVAARAFARLAELVAVLIGAASPGELGSHALGPGRGAAWAEMARGLLVHAVETDGERIAHYAIVAPTEWNFHPAGALPAALEGAAAADLPAAQHLLAAVAGTLDPCVALELEVRHA